MHYHSFLKNFNNNFILVNKIKNCIFQILDIEKKIDFEIKNSKKKENIIVKIKLKDKK